MTGVPSIVIGTTVSHESSAAGRSGSRRRKISRSVTTSVPAARQCARLGRRTAPIRSARSFISRRAPGFWASIVYCDVSTAISPPGRVNARDFTMKWLCIDWRVGLCTGS